MDWDLFFNSEEEFLRAIKKIYVNPKEAEEDIIHERYHYDEFVRLGYNPTYCLADGYFPQTIALNQEVIPEHKILIALAPQKPSPSDWEKAFKAYSRIPEKINWFNSRC